MHLDRHGREYLKFPFLADVDDLDDAEVYVAGAWYPASVDNEADPKLATVLLAGPDAPPDVVEDAGVLPYGVHLWKIRFTDNPEVVVRPVPPGFITVY